MMAVDLHCERQIIKLFQATFPAETGQCILYLAQLTSDHPDNDKG